MRQTIKVLGPFFVLLSFDQSFAAAKKAVKSEVPQLSFEEPSFNFGHMKRGEAQKHSFKFKNLGSEPVRILGAHATCGCTVTNIPKEAIPPQGTGEVELTLDTIQHRGTLQKTVLVLTDEPVIPERVLTIKAVIDDEISVDPPLVNWGKVDPQALPITKSVKIQGVQGFALDVKGLQFNKSFLDAKVEKIEDGYRLDVTLKTGAPFGPLRETLTIQNNSAYIAHLPVPLLAEVQHTVALAPQYLDFGQVVSGSSIERTVELTAGQDFEVKNFDADLLVNGEPLNNWRQFVDLKVESENAGSKNKQVRVSIKSGGIPLGAVHGQLYFYTAHQNERVDIDLYALVVEGKGN